MAEDVLTKGLLLAWLEGVPDYAHIALEIHEFGQLEFIVTDSDGQDRILRISVIPPDEQTDTETNGH